MRADEALRQSKDGKIWLNGKAAYSPDGILIWNSSEMRLVVKVYDIMSDQWQPAEPTKEKCEACMEMKMIENELTRYNKTDDAFHYRMFIIYHLKKYHCTCGG